MRIMSGVTALRDRAALAVLTLAATAIATEASAADTTGIGGVANNVSGNLQSVGNLLLGGSVLGGVGFAAAGLLKVKKAADSDGREPYGPGLWRLGVGGALVGLPTLTAAMKGTLFASDTGNVTVGNATFVR